MKVTWRAVVAFMLLALGVSVALWVSLNEHQAQRRRLSMWEHSLPHHQAPWSVRKWKRVLKQSDLPSPAYGVTQKTMTLTWSSVSAHALLAKFTEWLPQSAWRLEWFHAVPGDSVVVTLKRKTPNSGS